MSEERQNGSVYEVPGDDITPQQLLKRIKILERWSYEIQETRRHQGEWITKLIGQVAELSVALETLKAVHEARELEIKGRDYDHYREDDSPKGESVPGVRHRDA